MEKRIAISGPGSTSHLVALLALQNLALDPNQAKITFLTIPGTEINRRLALESGTVEATTLNGSVGDTYGQKGYPVSVQFQRFRSDDAADDARHDPPGSR